MMNLGRVILKRYLELVVEQNHELRKREFLDFRDSHLNACIGIVNYGNGMNPLKLSSITIIDRMKSLNNLHNRLLLSFIAIDN